MRFVQFGIAAVQIGILSRYLELDFFARRVFLDPVIADREFIPFRRLNKRHQFVDIPFGAEITV